ncbi:MAG: DUF4398 domain-containing protein [Bdellovibrionaceae bacterium]|nr:DUF4398 domain-containing protein [Pseudobdellovibrionaceae bacterium]
MLFDTKTIWLITLLGSLSSCVHPTPHTDIAATKIAIEYMNKAGAAKKATNLFNRSMQYYEQATALLKQRENVSAQKYLQLARTYAEKAEFKSRTKVNDTQKEW